MTIHLGVWAYEQPAVGNEERGSEGRRKDSKPILVSSRRTRLRKSIGKDIKPLSHINDEIVVYDGRTAYRPLTHTNLTRELQTI